MTIIPIDGFPENLDKNAFIDYELRDGYKPIMPSIASTLLWGVIEDEPDCEIVKYKIAKV